MSLRRFAQASFFVSIAVLHSPGQTIPGQELPVASLASPSPIGRNVLLLVADDLGIEQLALYKKGEDFPHTPRIDALAASGVTFLNAWSNPNCSPTRAGWLTGRHAFRTGIGHVVFSYTWGLARPEVTLAEALDLAPNPYASGMFGKWHLGSISNGGYSSANLAGFDRFDGSMFGFLHPQGYYDWDRVIDGAPAPCAEYPTTVHVDSALAWLQSVPEPWFCYVPFMAPHWPYEIPPPGLYYEDLSAEPTVRQIFKAMVEALDTELGRLLDGIAAAGYEPPLVIFTSDNGTDDAVVVPPVVPGKAKGTLYEGGIRVPLIVSGWDAIPPGSRSEALVQALDVFATVTDFAGMDVRQELPGVKIDAVSLRPLLADPSGPSIRKHLYSEAFYPLGLSEPWWHNTAIRDARYKLITNSSGESLYDLELDPTEATNLLAGTLTNAQQLAYEALKGKLVELDK